MGTTTKIEVQCDCCGKMKPKEQVSRIVAYGIETFACETCRGVDAETDKLSDELRVAKYYARRNGFHLWGW